VLRHRSAVEAREVRPQERFKGTRPQEPKVSRRLIDSVMKMADSSEDVSVVGVLNRCLVVNGDEFCKKQLRCRH
jgi:hypothetical protein